MAAGGNEADRAWVAQLRKGLVELLVLAVLRREEVYGYQLLQRLAELDGLALSESTLYPVLARLAADQLVAVRQEPSPTGPPRRYYRLTRAGQKRLDEMLAHWRQMNGSIEILAGSTEPRP
ncbi:MAG: PadR family transcriptional regulator [Phycisphaerales bacterium]|nr:PadR family transcriptional regulator [Phycisphaerales bacterium]